MGMMAGKAMREYIDRIAKEAIAGAGDRSTVRRIAEREGITDTTVRVWARRIDPTFARRKAKIEKVVEPSRSHLNAQISVLTQSMARMEEKLSVLLKKTEVILETSTALEKYIKS